MLVRTRVAACALGTLACVSTAQVGEIPVKTDYMTSGFFFASSGDFIRGDEPNSGRATHRTTTPTFFGLAGETSYLGFDCNPAAFSGWVPQAFLRVENVPTGFFADVSPGNPAEISVHSLTRDPLLAIDDTLASGAGSWIEFRDTELTTSSILSTNTLDGFGVMDWDITSLVNDWIANGTGNFAYTVGMSALLDPDPEAAVAFVNSSAAGLTGDEVTARIVVVPTPAAVAMLGIGGLLSMRRRR